jgi:hypothetical protein
LLLDERSFLKWFVMGFTTLLSTSILTYGNTTDSLILTAIGFGIVWMGVGLLLERDLQGRMMKIPYFQALLRK